MRILGIDPGLNITGYGVVDAQPGPGGGPAGGRVRLIEAGIIRGGAGKSLAHRVNEIHAGLTEAIESVKPDALALEELYSHYDRPKTAILMGHARGVIVLAGVQAGLPVKHYPATQIKKVITGNGRAPKSQMQLAIQRELGLKTLPEPADVADALAIALTHWYLTEQPKAAGLGIGD